VIKLKSVGLLLLIWYKSDYRHHF